MSNNHHHEEMINGLRSFYDRFCSTAKLLEKEEKKEKRRLDKFTVFKYSIFLKLQRSQSTGTLVTDQIMTLHKKK